MIEERKIEVVESWDIGGGYDWSVVEFGIDNEGECWLRAGSGCSCDSIGEIPWAPFTKELLESSAHSFLNSYGGVTSNDAASCISALQGFLPNAKSKNIEKLATTTNNSNILRALRKHPKVTEKALVIIALKLEH